MSVEQGARRAVLGKWAWTLWWPLAPWLFDVATVATFRPTAVTEPTMVLGLSAIGAFALLWFWRAPRAIRKGHPRKQVLAITFVASFGVYIGMHLVQMSARILEATIVGNDQAWLFITTWGKPVDHTNPIGTAEYVGLFGFLLLFILMLPAWGITNKVKPDEGVVGESSERR